jgi:uncharacterized membrane protein
MAREIFIYLLIGFIIGGVAGAAFVYSRIETIVQERIGRRERDDRLGQHK